MPTIDKDQLRVLRADIEAAIADVAVKHKCSLSLGRATFIPEQGTATFKLEVAMHGAGNAPRNLAAEQFTACAELYGLRPEDLGKEIMLQDRKFRISGLKPKARKNNIIVREIGTGKEFVTNPATVRRALV